MVLPSSSTATEEVPLAISVSPVVGKPMTFVDQVAPVEPSVNGVFAGMFSLAV